jgi:CBS domain-containing protein
MEGRSGLRNWWMRERSLISMLTNPFTWHLSAWGSAGVDLLPVVSRADINKLEGILLLRDVLDSYGVSAEDQN